MKIDMHVHSNGISLCSKVSCQTIIDEKIRLGYDGAVLTNHCQPWYYPAEEHKSFVERVIEEFHRGKKYAEEKDFRFYLGLEITLSSPYADWLLYGVTEEFLRHSPCLYQLTQKELFELCKAWGVLLVQAHPFRQGCTLGASQYMHGVEINCTPIDLDKVGLVESFAEAHGLLVLCGTDYHATDRTYFGGTYLPKDCQTAADVAEYLRNAKSVKIFQNDENKEYEKSVFVGK